MKKFETLDLSAIMNHKLVYDVPPTDEKEAGLDNIYILKEDNRLKEIEQIDGIDFAFRFGACDNVVCEGQTLGIGKRVDKLHIIGFSYWGDIHEYVRILDEKNREKQVQISLADWAHPSDEDTFTREFFKGEKITTVKIVKSSGRACHLVYFHHCIAETGMKEPIRKLIFPDNMFTHIFAITLGAVIENI